MAHSFWHALSVNQKGFEDFLEHKLTCALSKVRSLNHGSPSGSFPERDFINDCVLFDDCPTLDAKSIACCLIIFNDSTTAIRTHCLLRESNRLMTVVGNESSFATNHGVINWFLQYS